MNKLTALSKLAGAYHYLYTRDSADSEIPARVELDVRFGQIRRSLSIEDLKPQPKHIAEGYNGRMPTHF